MNDSPLPSPETPGAGPADLAVGGENWADTNVADPVRAEWRAEIAALGGRSPLVHFVDDPTTRIELTSSHPGGLARFIAGAPTLLSQLIRDDVALRTARLAADRITAVGLELASTRGIDSVHLGIGLTRWRHDDEDYCAPVLLRPLSLRQHGRDFEVRLRGGPRLNPGLARVLGEHFGIRLDPTAFVALTDVDGSFKPNAVIDQLRALTGHIFDFDVSPRLVASSFAEVAPQLSADAVNLDHPVLDAIAGNSTARWSLKEGRAEAAESDPDRRDPQADSLLLEADGEQERVVAEVAAGNSVVVKTLPGTGGTQTVVNAIGALVGQNKRVLVVSPRRATVRHVVRRLGDIGLAGLAVSPGSLRRDLIRAIGRNEKAAKPALGEVDDALVRLRQVLLDYRDALSRPDPDLDISVLDCIAELSRLALLPHPPSTTARLTPATLRSLAVDRSTVAETMVEAARLGEFRYGPGDSPWYGAQFAHGEEVTRAHTLAQALHEETLPRLLEKAERVIGATRMRPFESVDELGEYLRLLTEIRDTLDRFDPAVFDRSLTDLIAATSPRRLSRGMGRVQRRRLRKLAKEYLRPGMHVHDLAEALSAVQQQRIRWQRYVAAGVTPEVPTGIGDVQVAWQQVSADLASLDAPLGLSGPTSLAALPIPQLTELLSQLAAESQVLDNLLERSEIRSRLSELQLDDLLADLADRHVTEAALPAELELAWWRSALDRLLAADRALLGARTEVLERLESDFRMVDEAHVSGQSRLLGWQLAESWKVGLVDHPEESDALKQLLRQPDVTSGKLQALSPNLSRVLAPVWICSPYDIPLIDDRVRFDTVLILDAGASSIAENAGAIRRGQQLVAFGDPVTQTPSPFRLGLDPGSSLTSDTSLEPPTADELAHLHDSSVLSELSELLPVLSLTRSYRAGGEDLAELVNRRFYAGRIDALPWAGSFLGHGSLSLDFVEGSGLPDPETGAVESVEAEVNRVVELVIDHAMIRPHESLMVVTPSGRHAARVMQAVLEAMRTRPELVSFVTSDRAEPFAVSTIERAVAQSRDRVIFSVGYGRTPHGRVLSDFGTLGQPGGERMLAVAMTRARRSMVMVSCFRADDVDRDRLMHGARALVGVLEEIDLRDRAEALPDGSDPMLVDLARRLSWRGLRVELGHRGKLDLVAANGGTCVVVETDDVLQGRSLREALRLRPELLRRLGWHYARVHAFDLFQDPDGVADRIARIAGITIPVANPTGPYALAPAPKAASDHAAAAAAAPAVDETSTETAAVDADPSAEHGVSAATPAASTPAAAAPAASDEPITEEIPIVGDSRES